MSEGRDYDIAATMTGKCLLSGEGREWGVGGLGEEWRLTEQVRTESKEKITTSYKVTEVTERGPLSQTQGTKKMHGYETVRLSRMLYIGCHTWSHRAPLPPISTHPLVIIYQGSSASLDIAFYDSTSINS